MNTLKRITTNLRITQLVRSRFTDKFHDKERQEEKIFIDKEERKLMKKLLEKLGKEEKKEATPEPKDHNRDELGQILKKHKKQVPEELFEDLLRWKQGFI